MGTWEKLGKSDEWYTPKYIFDAIGEKFDLDVAHPFGLVTHVPADSYISEGSLDAEWCGFIWMNPPFGGRGETGKWLDKFFNHGNGIALTTDMTSSSWYQKASRQCCGKLEISGRVKFIRPDGSIGKSPANGTTLWASGNRAVEALKMADQRGLGVFYVRGGANQ